MQDFENINLGSDYDICYDKIKELRNGGMEWSNIKNAIISSSSYFDFVFSNIPDYKDKLDVMINQLKYIEDNAKQNTGYIYSDDVTNDIKVSSNPNSAWQRFDEKCLKQYGLETEENCRSSAVKILERLKLESYNEEPGKGLVMGYVQSGKTMNIESVITLAADYNFNVFIMLSGTIENLRMQNLKRLQNDIEFSKNSNVQWKFFDNIKDPTANIDGILNNNRARIVTVCLKNSTRLKNMEKWLNSTSNITKRKMKVILIDDEADQASLNTKKIEKEEQSKINEEILKIVNNKNFCAMNYISYTATPYGNFLNESSVESLYPQNFIISLPKSSQYIGPGEIFGIRNDEKNTDGLNIIEEITDEEYENLRKMDDITFVFPESLKKALCWFICTLAIQRKRNSKKPVTMLIHTDSKTIVHAKTREIIKKWLLDNIHELPNMCQKVYEEEIKKITKEDFLEKMPNYNLDGKHNIEDYPKYEEITDEIKEILENGVSAIKVDNGDLKYHKGIHLVIDNSDNRGGYDENNDYIRLSYPDEDKIDFAVGIIAIGGNTLARGLTLNGLTTSYFARNVNQVDTLLQMGRWFGYRTGYELLPRIWLTDLSLAKFREIADIEERLRDDLKKYDLGVKPSEYAPKIQMSYITRFSLSSKNKMQGAIQSGANYEKVDDQTVIFKKDKEVQKNNYEVTINFVNELASNYKKFDSNDGNVIFNKVDYMFIKNNLLGKMKFYENDRFFGNIKFFFDWMKREKRENEVWDIIIDNGQNGQINDVHDIIWKKTNRSKRKKSLEDVIDIGVLRNPSHRKNMYYYENHIIEDTEDIKIPKLFIYMIDGNSKRLRKENESAREDLNFGQDIAGLDLYIPNTGKPKGIIITQEMKK